MIMFSSVDFIAMIGKQNPADIFVSQFREYEINTFEKIINVNDPY